MNVSLHRYRRHLGLPPDLPMEGAIADLAAGASRWYEQHGEPWVRTTRAGIDRIEAAGIVLAGEHVLRSSWLANRLLEARVEALSVVAATAGERVDAEVRRLWSEGRPDESFFLGALAITVAEDLRESAGREVELAAGSSGWKLLPCLGPGHEGWDLADMASLVSALDDRGPIRVLESGGLVPERSTVVALAWTRMHATLPADGSASTQTGGVAAAGYEFPAKTLEKWSRERLRIERAAGGRLTAHFHFDGKTCSSLSRPLAYEYRLELELEDWNGYRITAASCTPAPGGRGHRFQCEHLSDPEGFSRLTASAPGIAGRTLDEACAAPADVSPSACLCSQANRNHKWWLVVQTVHYALCSLAAVGRNHVETT